MAIKWKNISTSNAWKTMLTIVFALSIMILVAAYSYISLDQNSEYAIEALYESNYIQSIKHKNEVIEFFESLRVVSLGEGGEMEDAERILSHTDFWYKYEIEKGKDKEGDTDKVYNYDNDNLSISVFPCLYSWSREEGFTLGDDTNETMVDYDPQLTENMKSVKVGYPSGVVKKKQMEWERLHKKVRIAALVILVSAILAIIALVWLIIVAGMKKYKNETGEKRKAVYTELQLLVGLIGILYWLYGDSKIWKGFGGKEGRIIEFEQSVSAVTTGVIAGICALLLLYPLLSVIGKVRNDTLWSTSIFYKTVNKAVNGWKQIITGEAFYQCKLAKRERNRLLATAASSFVFLILLIIMSILGWIPFILLSLLAILFCLAVYWWGGWKLIQDYARVDKQINDIYTGNYNTKSELEEKSPYYETSKKMALIGDGIQTTLEEKMQSERMKIELVTNVSHDLKTPLTSIISYVDLLAREENLSEEARDYVSILVKKSARLKEIVSDVFELAKTTSGEIKLDIKRIDLHKLIIQTVADMEDKIEKMQLTVRLNMPEGPVYVMSDGKILYRVLQNLIDNTLKYSLKGTRIYIHLGMEEGKAVIIVKNTANYEMTFTKEDILERFFRADKARTTEGSGLGISIAHAFTNSCGGEMDVNVDGDMFKVILRFPSDTDSTLKSYETE